MTGMSVGGCGVDMVVIGQVALLWITGADQLSDKKFRNYYVRVV